MPKRKTCKRNTDQARRAKRIQASRKKAKDAVLNKRYAYHEAGHAVLACILREPFEYVSIEREKGTHGRLARKLRPIREKRGLVERNGTFRLQVVGASAERQVEKRAIIMFAGIAAETALYKTFNDSSAGAQSDYDLAFQGAMELFRDEDVAADYVDYIQYRMIEIIMCAAVTTAVTAVARRLLKKKRLTAKEVRSIVKPLAEGDWNLKRVVKHEKFNRERVADKVAIICAMKDAQPKGRRKRSG